MLLKYGKAGNPPKKGGRVAVAVAPWGVFGGTT